MPEATRMTDVVVAVTDLVRGALGPSWDVANGPRLAPAAVLQYVTIGETGDTDQAPYESEREQRDSMGRRYVEVWRIRCDAGLSSGRADPDGVEEMRSQVGLMLNVVNAALTGSDLLEGATHEMQLGPTIRWWHLNFSGQLGVGATFEVTGRTFLQ